MSLSQSDMDKNQVKQQLLTRQVAWCVMLGIDNLSQEYQNFESMYHDVIANNSIDNEIEAQVVRQIEVDVYRTFRPFNLKFLNAKV